MIRARSCAMALGWIAAFVWIGAPELSAQAFVRGDCNVDAEVDLSDAVFLLLHNFAGTATPTCLDACDFNDDGVVTGQVTDPIYLLSFLFGGGPLPSGPGPSLCGPDPSDDDLIGCEEYPHCVEECPVIDRFLDGIQQDPDIAVHPQDDTYVLAWEDDRDGDGQYQIRAAIFAADGEELVDPFTVNDSSRGQQLSPQIAIAPDGHFVVVWEDDSNDNGILEVRARAFHSDGTEYFPQFDVNVSSSGQQSNARIAMDDKGNFVVVWEDDRNKDGLYNLLARGFHADGTERIPTYEVNERSSGQQTSPDIAMTPDGAYVIVWEDDGRNDGLFEINAVVAGPDGMPRFNEFTVNSRNSGQQRKPSVAINAEGSFLVAWEDDRDGDGNFQVHARCFAIDGTEQIAQFTVNERSAGQQYNVHVSMDRAGNFALAWEDDRDNDGQAHVTVGIFLPDGTPHGAQGRADCLPSAEDVDNQEPAVMIDSMGRVRVFWEELDLMTGGVQVLGRVMQ